MHGTGRELQSNYILTYTGSNIIQEQYGSKVALISITQFGIQAPPVPKYAR
jgi:hypothetical protein